MDIPPISERQHLEIYVLPNRYKEEEKNSTGISLVIAIILVFIIVRFPGQFTADVNVETDPQPNSISEPQPPIPPVGGGSPSTSNPSSRPSRHAPELHDSGLNRRVRIAECNGMRLEGANFREYPSLDPQSIKGVILAGTWVTLTGFEAYEDGITWYEVINNSDVFSSAQYRRTRLIGSDQTGWIAGCFVES